MEGAWPQHWQWQCFHGHFYTDLKQVTAGDKEPVVFFSQHLWRGGAGAGEQLCLWCFSGQLHESFILRLLVKVSLFEHLFLLDFIVQAMFKNCGPERLKHWLKQGPAVNGHTGDHIQVWFQSHYITELCCLMPVCQHVCGIYWFAELILVPSCFLAHFLFENNNI